VGKVNVEGCSGGFFRGGDLFSSKPNVRNNAVTPRITIISVTILGPALGLPAIMTTEMQAVGTAAVPK
jgi:hypothetical protein